VETFDDELFDFPQPQGHEWHGDVMAGHVTDRSGAELPPIPPVEWMQLILVPLP